MRRREGIFVNFIKYEMYFGQFDIVLICSIIETIMPVVIVNIAGMREAVQEGEHVLETVTMQVLVGNWHEELVRGGQSQLGDYRKRRVHVDEHD